MFLPQKSPWVEEFVDQWTAFPNGRHDDMVDSASQALSYLQTANGTPVQEEEPPPPPDLWDVYA